MKPRRSHEWKLLMKSHTLLFGFQPVCFTTAGVLMQLDVVMVGGLTFEMMMKQPTCAFDTQAPSCGIQIV